MDLETPITKLNRVGATMSKRLGRLGIKTAGDLINWYPLRYEDFRRISKISELKEGELITVKVRLELIANKRIYRRHKSVTEALVSDQSGSLRVVWFNQPFIAKNLKAGDILFLSGKVKADMLGPTLQSPIYEKETKQETTHTARIVPVYPLTEGLTQKQMRYLISQALPAVKNISDWLPSEILEKFDLVPLKDALVGVHFPEDEVDLRKCTERLKFDELLMVQMKAEMIRREKVSSKAPVCEFMEKEIKEFVAGLPFVLTKAQKIAAWEILKDMQKIQPMNRLLSGDVGSGKTVVAALALFSAVLNGYQGVFMAPTEILARQHYDTIAKLLGKKLSAALLTRSQFSNSNPLALKSGISKNEIITAIGSGSVDIVIGTHALLSEKIEFKDVGLIIVDEQHRFGVGQRKAIKDKTADISAHYLSMTATPIPRSLALMIYGDLDLSVINELPIGRKPIITRLVEPKNREKAYQFIRNQIKQGRQVFVICPIIDQKIKSKIKKSGDEIEIVNYNFFTGDERKSVTSEFEKLSKIIFPDLKVGYLHGKLKPAEKEAVMEKFNNNEISILVSTSVVEVGVDIPNASVMMIEGADRFGLAQLHQFRGRVGRSSYQSYCMLFTESDSAKVLDRLNFFETHLDGFKLAEKDLETRGPGEVYGTEQSGLMHLRLAKLTDRGAIKKARDAAAYLADNLSKFPLIKAKIAVWEQNVHLE